MIDTLTKSNIDAIAPILLFIPYVTTQEPTEPEGSSPEIDVILRERQTLIFQASGVASQTSTDNSSVTMPEISPSTIQTDKILRPELEKLIGDPADLEQIRALRFTDALQDAVLAAIEKLKEIYDYRLDFDLTYSKFSKKMWVEYSTDLSDIDEIISKDSQFHDNWYFPKRLSGVDFDQVGFRSIPVNDISLD